MSRCGVRWLMFLAVVAALVASASAALAGETILLTVDATKTSERRSCMRIW